MSTSTAYKRFYNSIRNLPIWVKQVIYYTLQDEIEENIQQNIQLVNREDLLQFYVPERTFKGDREMQDKYYNLREELYLFLENCDGETNMATIAMNNGWSLTEVAKFMVELITIEFLQKPGSDMMATFANFLCGNIRLGEYCKRIDKIGIDSLVEALNYQQKAQKSGKKLGIGDILVEMGMLTAQERDEILRFKEDSARTFRMGAGPEADAKTLEMLKTQNNALKEQLKKYQKK
jgi:hypothetical protein